MSTNPSSIDQTNSALFKFQLDKIPNVVYWSYSVPLPGITFGEVIQPTPFLDVKRPGDKLVFDPLTVNFIVQENLANYIEIYNWLIGIGKPESFDQYRTWTTQGGKSSKQNIYSDAILTIFSNKYNPIVRVKFIDCFPTALSPLTYDSSMTDVTPITTDATFSYSYYKIEAL